MSVQVVRGSKRGLRNMAHSVKVLDGSNPFVNSDDGAQLLKNILIRKGASTQFNKQHKDENGYFQSIHNFYHGDDIATISLH